MTSPRKTRKPRFIYWGVGRAEIISRNVTDTCPILISTQAPMTISEARKLAAWLLKAADYLEQKQKGPK